MRKPKTAGSIGCSVLRPGGLGRRGQIVAVFERAAHLLTEQGVYLTLGGAGLPQHPYSVLWPGYAGRALSLGQTVAVTAKGLCSEGEQLADFRGLEVFTPRERAQPMASAARRREALEATVEAMSALPDRGGFQAMLCGGPAGQPRDSGVLAARLDCREWALGARLARCLAACDWDGLTQAALDLAGMGEGLTPAGDDFLGGALCALRFHGRRRGRPVLPQLFGEGLAAHAGLRTTPFSAFLLACAASGQVARPLADWLQAVHQGLPERAAGLTPAIAELGHSSGLDALSGMALALQNLPGEPA